MADMLLVVFALETVALLAWGVWKPGRVYQYPFLAAATFFGFVLPQLAGLTWGANLPPGSLEKTLVLAIVCEAMCFLGYVCPNKPLQNLQWQFDEERLLVVAGVLSLVGAIFYFRISRLPDELIGAGQWSGLPVAYNFFAKLLHYGFAIALLLYARSRSTTALAIILFDCLFFFDRIVIAARRGVIAEFLLCILCAWWFARRVALPRWVVLGGVVLAVLFVYSTGAYRKTVYKDQDYGTRLKHSIPWQDVLEIDFVQNFWDAIRDSPEMRNAIYRVDARSRTGNYDLGVSFWNDLVFQYVPAQVLGREFKESLTIEAANDIEQVYGYLESPGSTATGMADSFEAFGYPGCLLFFLMAFVLRKLFEAGQARHVAAQLCYMLVVTNSLHAITHHTKWFVTPCIHLAFFLFPALWWTRRRRGGTPREAVPEHGRDVRVRAVAVGLSVSTGVRKVRS